jgi:hypothetical protein
LGHDGEVLVDIYSGLGGIAAETNDPRTCYEAYEKLAELTRRRNPLPTKTEELEETIVASNALGITRMMTGHIDAAYLLFDEARCTVQRQTRISKLTTQIYLLSSASLGQAQWIDAHHDAALYTLQEAWDFYNTPLTSQKELGSA